MALYLSLTPKTNKGKNKIHEAGSPDVWRVAEQREYVGFSDRKGPWLHIVPKNPSDKADKSRWIHAHDDPDFRSEVAYEGE